MKKTAVEHIARAAGRKVMWLIYSTMVSIITSLASLARTALLRSNADRQKINGFRASMIEMSSAVIVPNPRLQHAQRSRLTM